MDTLAGPGQHQGFGTRHQGGISDDPTHVPIGHWVGFRQATHHHTTLGHARRYREAQVLVLQCQVLMDFIDDHPQVMGNGESGDGLH
ncbi:hypothetical protein D3C76_792850 [compost metagenome]